MKSKLTKVRKIRKIRKTRKQKGGVSADIYGKVLRVVQGMTGDLQFTTIRREVDDIIDQLPIISDRDWIEIIIELRNQGFFVRFDDIDDIISRTILEYYRNPTDNRFRSENESSMAIRMMYPPISRARIEETLRNAAEYARGPTLAPAAVTSTSLARDRDTWSCGKCTLDNPKSSKHCDVCGNFRPWYCRNCGQKNVIDENVCSQCRNRKSDDENMR